MTVTKERPDPQAEPQRLTLQQALHHAQQHLNARNFAQAETICRRIVEAQPGQPDALHMLGLVALALGRTEAALAHVRSACTHPRAPAVYHSNLAELCRRAGLHAEGEKAGRRAVALNDTMPGGWNNLGILLQEQGKLEESRECLEKAVALSPNEPEAHNNLANTLKLLGEYRGAAEHWGRALAIRPNYAEAHSNFSLLLLDQCKIGLAARAARTAIELNPRLADAYVNLATIENHCHRYAEALRLADAVLKFEPAHVAALVSRALALKNLGRLDEALEAAQKAVGHEPDNPEANNSLGTILQATGKFEEAMAAYDRTAELPGTVRERALINRAVLLMEHDRPREAEAAFDLAVESFPQSASAWFNRSDLVKFKAGDPAIAKMEGLLAAEQAPSAISQMLLHFALGKVYLDIGDSDAAFDHLNQGNAMKRATFHFDHEKTGAWLASIAEAFSQDVFTKFKGAGADSDLPIFVVGMPRSGTTLIEQILASHPDVQGGGELKLFQNASMVFGELPGLLSNVSPADVTGIGETYLAGVLPMAEGRKHLVDKMPANFIHAGLIHLALPNARIINSRRNPVDTCLSCYTKLFQSEQAFAYDLAELGHFNRDYRKLMDHWRAVLPAANLLDVDYEAVVEDTEAQVRRILEFAGLPWNDACLEFYRTKRPVRTASVNQVRKPIYKTSSGRWRKHAANLKPLLDALGAEE